jgi:hypothetical protein
MSIDIYEVHPRKDHRGVDLISDALPFGRLWYDTPDHAMGYAIALQPFTRCCDPRLWCGWQRDRNARAQGGFQRLMNLLAFAEGLSFWLVL